MLRDLANLTISLGRRLGQTRSGTGRGPETTAGSSAWTPYLLTPRRRAPGWPTWSGKRNFTTSGQEAGSAISKDVTGKTCSHWYRMAGTGLLLAREFQPQELVATVIGLILGGWGKLSQITEKRSKGARTRLVLVFLTMFTRYRNLWSSLSKNIFKRAHNKKFQLHTLWLAVTPFNSPFLSFGFFIRYSPLPYNGTHYSYLTPNPFPWPSFSFFKL